MTSVFNVKPHIGQVDMDIGSATNVSPMFLVLRERSVPLRQISFSHPVWIKDIGVSLLVVPLVFCLLINVFFARKTSSRGAKKKKSDKVRHQGGGRLHKGCS